MIGKDDGFGKLIIYDGMGMGCAWEWSAYV